VRALIAFVAVAVAVVCQLTIVDRIAFPGGAGPNLVLVLVAALALATGPLLGALTGFWAGLALDVAPPGSHFTGQNALVFCLIGYLCGLLAYEPSGDGVAEQGHTALFEIVVTAAGAICGEALAVLLGVMLSDPRVTWPTISHVLPVAAAYDAVACPFVLFAAAAALRLAGARDEGRRSAAATRMARTASSGMAQGAGRPIGTQNAPRLRLAGGGKGEGWIGGLHGQGTGGGPVPRREPRLKLGRGLTAGGGLGTALAGGGPAKVRFAGRRREGVLGGSLLGGSALGGRPGGSALGARPAGSGSAALARTRMGRSVLGGSVFSRPSPSLARTVPAGGTMLPGRSLVPRFSRGKALSRLTGAMRRSARPRSPGKGWLPRTSPRSAAMGRGALGASTMGRRAFKSSAFKSSAFKSSAFKSGAFKSGAYRSGAYRSGAFNSGTRGAFRGGSIAGTSWKRGLRTGGPARLRMPRRRFPKRSWRTGGYR
jgi:rod shape-determining protein MreD